MKYDDGFISHILSAIIILLYYVGLPLSLGEG